MNMVETLLHEAEMSKRMIGFLLSILLVGMILCGLLITFDGKKSLVPTTTQARSLDGILPQELGYTEAHPRNFLNSLKNETTHPEGENAYVAEVA